MKSKSKLKVNKKNKSKATAMRNEETNILMCGRVNLSTIK